MTVQTFFGMMLFKRLQKRNGLARIVFLKRVLTGTLSQHGFFHLEFKFFAFFNLTRRQQVM